jgi:ribosomal protein S18 acetylase RimI-like enzyme
VVSLRGAEERDGLDLWLLVRGPGLIAGDVPVLDELGMPDVSCLLDARTRVAEADDGGLVGACRLHLWTTAAGPAGQLLFLAVDGHGRRHGVDRLLLDDVTRLAALGAVDRLHVVTTPPHDRLFRQRGAAAVRLAAPCGRITWPRVVLELPVR